MIRFTRTLQTGGLHIRKEHATETISFKFTDGHFVVDDEPDIRIGFELLRPTRHLVIGTEYYSLTIYPHYGIDDDWQIEGLRADNENEIWYTETFDDCLTEFRHIEQLIREQGHTIAEPDSFDMEQAFRTFYKTRLGMSDFDRLGTPFRGIGDLQEKMQQLKRRS